MADLFSRLAGRAQGVMPAVLPRQASRFEGAAVDPGTPVPAAAPASRVAGALVETGVVAPGPCRPPAGLPAGGGGAAALMHLT